MPYHAKKMRCKYSCMAKGSRVLKDQPTVGLAIFCCHCNAVYIYIYMLVTLWLGCPFNQPWSNPTMVMYPSVFAVLNLRIPTMLMICFPWANHCPPVNQHSYDATENHQTLPSGKPTKNYGTSPCYQWVNPLQWAMASIANCWHNMT